MHVRLGNISLRVWITQARHLVRYKALAVRQTEAERLAKLGFIWEPRPGLLNVADHFDRLPRAVMIVMINYIVVLASSVVCLLAHQ